MAVDSNAFSDDLKERWSDLKLHHQWAVFALLILWIMGSFIYVILMVLGPTGIDMRYLTNWSMILQATFFALALVVYFVPTLEYVILDWVLCFMFGVVWQVATLATVLAASNPDSLWATSPSKSIAMLMNIFLHYVPLAAMLVYVLFRRHVIAEAYSAHSNVLIRVLHAIWVWTVAILWTGVFVLVVNVDANYSTKLTNSEFFAIAAAASALSCVTFYVIMTSGRCRTAGVSAGKVPRVFGTVTERTPIVQMLHHENDEQLDEHDDAHQHGAESTLVHE